MTFRVGQKVCCVNLDPAEITGGRGTASDYLVLRAVYTVRWIGLHPFLPWRKFGLQVRLVEVARPDDEYPEYADAPFGIWRFRPLVERKTDISFAHEILRMVSRKDRLRA